MNPKRARENMLQRRREFGVLLRGLRLKRGLSGAELAVKTGKLSRTTLASIELGQRQAGAQVSERLADALGLTGDDRQNFLVAGLRTTVGELLPQKSKGLDPEHFSPMWRLLMSHGIRSNDGHRIRLDAKLSSESSAELKRAASRLAEKAANLSARIRGALEGTDDPFMLDIEIEVQDGTVMLVQLLPASSKILPPPNSKPKLAQA